MISISSIVQQVMHSLAFYFVLALLPLTLRILYVAYATPLRKVPGPFFAKFTRLWYVKSVNSRRFEKINVQLHRQHGPVVRIAPNEYSIDDPEAAAIIYRSRDQLVKAPRYSSWGLPNAEPNLFTSLDVEHNAGRRRQAAALYQMGALTNIEYQVDIVSDIFMKELGKFVQEGSPFDLAKWLQFYTFDAISALTFGQPVGFLTDGLDIADVMETVHTYSRYGAVIGGIHEWHPLIFRIMQMLAPKGEVGLAYVLAFAKKGIDDWSRRSEAEKSIDEEKNDGGEILKTDYMSSFLAKHRKTPESFQVEDTFYHIISNVVAGGETTGASLSAAMYFLIKTPRVLEKLRRELDGLKKGPREMICVKDTQDCAYLQAVIKEVLRLFPATGLPMARVVPEGGLTLCGHFFPEGAVVGVNSWVAHANRAVFGQDADEFRPERWLEEQTYSNQMDQYFFTFGRGPRTCVGKSVSLMEMNKLIPLLVLHFDFQMADPNHDWTVHNDWFVRQQDFQVRVSKRKTATPKGTAR